MVIFPLSNTCPFKTQQCSPLASLRRRGGRRGGGGPRRRNRGEGGWGLTDEDHSRLQALCHREERAHHLLAVSNPAPEAATVGLVMRAWLTPTGVRGGEMDRPNSRGAISTWDCPQSQCLVVLAAGKLAHTCW